MAEQNKLDLFAEEKKYMTGKCIVMIFHNDQNLYSVARIRIKDTNESYEDKEVVITGYFPRLHEEELYTFYGKFQDHPKFGRQYLVDHFRKELPQTTEGIIQYLSSDLFKGIGKKTAENIVKTLGESAITLILENPAVLEEVPRLAEEKARIITTTLQEHEGLEQVMIALSQYGFGPQLSMKIYQAYVDETLDVIQQNPYQLIEDIEGIGFNRADELGRALGLKGNHPDRLKAGVLYTLDQMSMQEGHVFLYVEELIQAAVELLDRSEQPDEHVTKLDVEQEITALTEDKRLIVEDDKAYLPSLYFSEKGLVNNMNRLLTQTEFADTFAQAEFLKELGALEERLGVEFAESQREAIQTAISSPMMLLTGGPGTGKTTVIKGIVEVFAELQGISLNVEDYQEAEPFPVVLAAPTGRAAKRMSEATGLPALTIHRLLGWNGKEGFDHHEDHPIEGKLLIVDEVSMVDIWLAHQLFKAVPQQMQIVLVGDEDQLPSVGPGQVLKDMLSAKVAPIVKLTDIYRQAEGSSIIELAHRIKKGELPPDLTSPQADRRFFSCKADQIQQIVEQVSENAVKKGYSPKDIQILAPMYRGPAGIERLNKMLQELFNPKKEQKERELTIGETVFRVGDKVLQLVNQPEKQVFNGDIGEVVALFYAKENQEQEDQLVVSFDGNEVVYHKQDLTQLTLAYCCSIHKAQGSEFPIVIMPVVKGYYRMLRRNLIYTGITRSKRFLILCGEEEALEMAVKRTDDRRQTTLAEKLQAILHGNPELAEDELELEPIVEMENVSPYDFLD